jgi:hypothetical protein
MGNAEGSLFGLDSYAQIAACGTYRCRSQPLAAPFSDERRVALHVVGMLLTVVPPVVGARSVLFLLLRINTTEVNRVLPPPLLIGLSLLLAATVALATGLLPLLEPRMGINPTTTKRTSPPREHTLLLRRTFLGETGEVKEEKQKGKAIETEMSKNGRKSEAEEQIRPKNVSDDWPVKY